MARKRSYDTLIGGSVGWNQLCNDSSVTVQNGHKYYMSKGGAKSIAASTGAAITGLTSGTDMVIDLTLLLGSTIADHIYSLESSTSGAGIAKLREWGFIRDAYIPYDAGSIESVEASAKVTRDASDNIIGNYPLDSSLTLRGIPKLTDGKLWYDGDRYEADGTVTRRYGAIVYDGSSDEDWRLETSSSYTGANFYIARPNTNDPFDASNFMCNACLVGSDWKNGKMRPTVGYYNFVLGEKLGIADVTQWRTRLAQNPITLVYKFATPTTESASPFTNPQMVDPDGTEEYVTSNGVPVGHETRYQL